MRLGLLILIAIATVGIVIHGYLSTVRPFDVIRQSIRLFPRLFREKTPLILFALLVTAMAPLGHLVAVAGFSSAWMRSVFIVLWHAGHTALLALVAVRIHRGIILRDKSRWLRFGRTERRMLFAIMTVWSLALVLSLAPWIVSPVASSFALRAVTFTIPLLTWLLVVALAYVGPAASLGDVAPFRRSLDSVRGHFTATAAIVITLRGLLELVTIAVGSSLMLWGVKPEIAITVVPILIVASTFVFVISETAIAIALTRINENQYDETRSRDYNADWM